MGLPNGWRRYPDAPWAARRGHRGEYWDGKYWMLFGTIPGLGIQGDVWYSSDLQSWTEDTVPAGMTARWNFGCCVFLNKLWAVVGQASSGQLSDIWYRDTTGWHISTYSPGFSARSNIGLAVHDGKMWVVGGITGATTYVAEVYSSSDGVTWTREADLPAARWEVECISHDGRLYAIGGLDSDRACTNTIYSTEDGSSWTTHDPGEFEQRSEHRLVKVDGETQVMLFGGSQFDAGDVYVEEYEQSWLSSDALAWKKHNVSFPFPMRCDMGVCMNGDKVAVFGGLNRDVNLVYNQVWESGKPKIMSIF